MCFRAMHCFLLYRSSHFDTAETHWLQVINQTRSQPLKVNLESRTRIDGIIVRLKKELKGDVDQLKAKMNKRGVLLNRVNH